MDGKGKQVGHPRSTLSTCMCTCVCVCVCVCVCACVVCACVVCVVGTSLSEKYLLHLVNLNINSKWYLVGLENVDKIETLKKNSWIDS